MYVYSDSDGFAIDVGTQLPVHEAPLGPLCRYDGTPLENQPSQRMRGPEAITDLQVSSLSISSFGLAPVFLFCYVCFLCFLALSCFSYFICYPFEYY